MTLAFDPKQTTIFLWSSLYIPIDSAKKVVTTLREVHEAAGYQPYNPFPGGTGTPAKASGLVRLFVAPANDGWVRLIGQPNMDVMPTLAEKLNTTILYTWISETDTGVLTYGSKDLTPYLRAGKTLADVEKALDTISDPMSHKQPLTGEIGEIASQYGVDAGQANNLIQKTVGQVFDKLSKRGDSPNVQADAMSLFKKQTAPLWESEPGRRLQSVMACLTIPQNWQKPDFRDLAAAYQIACQLDQNEDMELLPGDEAILDKVEYPLDYKLAYFVR